MSCAAYLVHFFLRSVTALLYTVVMEKKGRLIYFPMPKIDFIYFSKGIERVVLYRETNILFLTIYYFGDENLFFFIFLVTRRRSIFEPTASFHWFQHKQRREKTMNHSTEEKTMKWVVCAFPDPMFRSIFRLPPALKVSFYLCYFINFFSFHRFPLWLNNNRICFVSAFWEETGCFLICIVLCFSFLSWLKVSFFFTSS